MNTVIGYIKTIEVSGSLSLVTVEVATLIFTTIIVETPATADYLHIGNTIKVMFKETEVVIGTGGNYSISLQNRIPASIIEIEQGALLSRVVMQSEVGEIVSIITSKSVDKLNLQQGILVDAMVKTNEIMISA
jgi:molybdate transport system regulatory protein